MTGGRDNTLRFFACPEKKDGTFSNELEFSDAKYAISAIAVDGDLMVRPSA